MAEILVIRLVGSMEPSCEWMVVDSAGTAISAPERGTLEQASALVNGRRLLVLVPATDVLRTRLQMPLRNAARIRQAIPFALEEQLARDIEHQHFAIGRRLANDMVPVAVVADKLMQGWLAMLQTCNLHPDAIYSESDAMLPLPATLTIMADERSAIVMDETGQVTASDLQMLTSVLELMIDSGGSGDESGGEPGPIHVLLYATQSALDQHQDEWQSLLERVDTCDIQLLPDGCLPRLASAAATAPGINLLQGKFAPQSGFSITWQPWRTAALLAAISLCLLLGIEVSRYWQLGALDRQLDQQATALLMNTFPDAAATNDPWEQLRQRLENLPASDSTQSTGFAEALEALAIAFAAIPDLQLDTLSYRQGSMDVQLRAPDVESLDLLRQRIAGPGRFAVEIQSANPDNDAIRGRMRVVAAGGV